MSDDPILVLHRGRFYEIDGASAERVASNTWQVRIPAADPIHKRTRRSADAESWDGAVFLVEGQETQPAVGSGEDKGGVTVTVFVL